MPEKKLQLLLDKSSMNIAETVASISGFGGRLFEYFEDNNIRKFSIYGGTDIAYMLCSGAYCEGLGIYKLLGPVSSSRRLHGTIWQMECIDQISEYDSEIPILYIEMPLDSGIRNKLKQLSKHVFSAYEVLQYSFTKNGLIKPLRSYIKDSGLNVTCVLCGLTDLSRVKNRSVNEDFMLYFRKNRKHPLHDRFMEKQYDEAYKVHGYDDEYIQQCTDIQHNVEERDGVYYMKDFQSRYVNFISGMRLTSDVPDCAVNHIFCMGNSIMRGVGVDDTKTIPSALQRLVNVYDQTSKNYAIYNCSNTSADDLLPIVPRLKAMPVKNGDIIVVMIKNIGLLEEYLRGSEIMLINSQPYFYRPHDMGEIFIHSVHMNHIGYQKYAEIIFSALKIRGAFNKKCFRNEEKQKIEIKQKTDDPPELEKYLSYLNANMVKSNGRIGAIVMNCNPFTLGHQYLIEYASSRVGQLYIFVVEEDKSFFAFADRLEMVKKGAAHLPNVTVLPSGQFIISLKTFEAYFMKDEIQDSVIDPSMDIALFGQKIAPVLNITVRFVGEEPFDNITYQYNLTMKLMLPKYGVEVSVIPRKEYGNVPISASRVRALLEVKDWEEISRLVPETTLNVLMEKYV